MSFWTEEKIQELKRLAPHHTASQIAAALGAESRNAIISKLRRLKLTLNPDRPRGQARPKITRTPREARMTPPVVAARTEIVRRPLQMTSQAPAETIRAISGSPPVSTMGGRYQCDIVHLSATTCRFPCWGDATPIGERRYCGAIAVDGLPYCHAHCRVAYVGQGCDKLITHSISPSSSQGESVPVSFAPARTLRESSVGSDDSRFFCGND